MDDRCIQNSVKLGRIDFKKNDPFPAVTRTVGTRSTVIGWRSGRASAAANHRAGGSTGAASLKTARLLRRCRRRRRRTYRRRSTRTNESFENDTETTHRPFICSTMILILQLLLQIC